MKLVAYHNEKAHEELVGKYEQAKDKLANQNLIIMQTEEVKEQNKALKALCEQLQEDNQVLKNENAALKATLVDHVDRIQKLETQVLQLQARDAPITIREAMRILERWICFEACGSKRKFVKYYNFDRINKSGDPAIQSALSSVLATLKLTVDHTDTLAFLKDCGDLCTHNRPAMTVEDWYASIVEMDEDKSDYDDEEALKKELLDALGHYIQPPVDGSAWVIVDPVASPVPKPVLRIKQAVGAPASV